MNIQNESNIKRFRKRKWNEITDKDNIPICDKVHSELNWKIIKYENLNLSYCSTFLSSCDSQRFFTELEKEVKYLSGDLAKVRVYGKWHNLPRQQAAYGDIGLTYKFSGFTIPALSWTSTVLELKTRLEELIPYKFNFCLINRYRNGTDSIGEHRDDEKELDNETPIASISLGQHRDFVFRHKDCRSKNLTRKIEPYKILLENGSVLLMNPPTNTYWYHSLPVRKKLPGIRINLTYRRIVSK